MAMGRQDTCRTAARQPCRAIIKLAHWGGVPGTYLYLTASCFRRTFYGYCEAVYDGPNDPSSLASTRTPTTRQSLSSQHLSGNRTCPFLLGTPLSRVTRLTTCPDLPSVPQETFPPPPSPGMRMNRRRRTRTLLGLS
jgi:hypothetical protein